MPQFNMMLEGLGKILEQKYGSKSKSTEAQADIKELNGLKPESPALDLKAMFKKLADKQKKKDLKKPKKV